MIDRCHRQQCIRYVCICVIRCSTFYVFAYIFFPQLFKLCWHVERKKKEWDWDSESFWETTILCTLCIWLDFMINKTDCTNGLNRLQVPTVYQHVNRNCNWIIFSFMATKSDIWKLTTECVNKLWTHERDPFSFI